MQSPDIAFEVNASRRRDKNEQGLARTMPCGKMPQPTVLMQLLAHTPRPAFYFAPLWTWRPRPSHQICAETAEAAG
jgi:hypothetical protein